MLNGKYKTFIKPILRKIETIHIHTHIYVKQLK